MKYWLNLKDIFIKSIQNDLYRTLQQSHVKFLVAETIGTNNHHKLLHCVIS